MSTSDDEAERAWMAAFNAWSAGSKAEMADWIRNLEKPLPEDARAFFADLILGKVKHRSGRRQMRKPAYERQIITMVYAARERAESRGRNSRPADVAIEEVARTIRRSPDTVRGIVRRMAAAGISFERWKQWGRPTF